MLRFIWRWIQNACMAYTLIFAVFGLKSLLTDVRDHFRKFDPDKI